MPNQTRAADPYLSCWVSASAGSGKTKVLVDRLMNLLVMGVDPQRILCLTFTRAAAAEMLQRLTSQLRLKSLQDQQLQPVFLKVLDTPPRIQTIHSFCQQLLTRFPLEAGLTPKFSIEDDLSELLDQSLDQVDLTTVLPHWSEGRFRDLLQSYLDDHRLHTLSPMRLIDEQPSPIAPEQVAHYLTQTGQIRKKYAHDPQAEETYRLFNQWLAWRLQEKNQDFFDAAHQVRAHFNALKLKRQMFGFDDLIRLSQEMLSQTEIMPWIAHKLSAQIEHVLVDEAQDNSTDQWRLLQHILQDVLSLPGRTLFVVGDPKQSIYGFQGAVPHHFMNLKDYFAQLVAQQGGQWAEISLDRSFRSTAQVLYCVDGYFQENPQGVHFSGQKIHHQAHRQDPGSVTFWPLVHEVDDSQETAAQHLAREIAHLVSRGTNPGDIMVLVKRRTVFVDYLIRALKRRHIATAGLDRLYLQEHLAIQDLLNLAQWILTPDDDFALACVLKSPLFRWQDHDLERAALGREKSLFDVLEPSLQQTLNQWRYVANSLVPFDFFGQILAQGGRQAFINQLGSEVADVLDEFLMFLLTLMSDGIASLQEVLMTLLLNPPLLKREMTHTHEVRILTVHGSKGLEAPVVIIVDSPETTHSAPFIVKGQEILLRPPLAEDTPETRALKAQQDQMDAAEENRLLYVAMTRARDHLYITGWEHSRGKAVWYQSFVDTLTPEITPFTADEPPQQMQSLEKVAVSDNAFVLPRFYIPIKKPAVSSPMTRGERIHRMLEAMALNPGVDIHSLAQRYLKMDPDREPILLKLTQAQKNPAWHQFFDALALSEVALEDPETGESIRLDRLCVRPHYVGILDFKTHQKPPDSQSPVPQNIQDQMAKYARIVAKLYPQSQVETYVLWTQTLDMRKV